MPVSKNACIARNKHIFVFHCDQPVRRAMSLRVRNCLSVRQSYRNRKVSDCCSPLSIAFRKPWRNIQVGALGCPILYGDRYTLLHPEVHPTDHLSPLVACKPVPATCGKKNYVGSDIRRNVESKNEAYHDVVVADRMNETPVITWREFNTQSPTRSLAPSLEHSLIFMSSV